MGHEGKKVEHEEKESGQEGKESGLVAQVRASSTMTEIFKQ